MRFLPKPKNWEQICTKRPTSEVSLASEQDKDNPRQTLLIQCCPRESSKSNNTRQIAVNAVSIKIIKAFQETRQGNSEVYTKEPSFHLCIAGKYLLHRLFVRFKWVNVCIQNNTWHSKHHENVLSIIIQWNHYPIRRHSSLLIMKANYHALSTCQAFFLAPY